MFFMIAIPVYNAEDYLDECIQSVINQTEKDFEILLVNDGSKDKSIDICKKWHALFPKIVRYIDNPNQGSLLARRCCLREACGNYILIIDADDYIISKNALSEIKASLIASHADLVFFNYTKNAYSKEKAVEFPFTDQQVFESEDLALIYDQIIETRNMNELWNKVYKKEIVDADVDYSVFSDVCIGTDFFQVLPILFNAKKIEYLDRVYYFYRTTKGSIIHRFHPQMEKSLRISQEWLEFHANKSNLQIDNLDKKLATRYMISTSTIANKAKLLSNRKDIEYHMKKIGEDSLFRKRFIEADIGKLPLKRRVIVSLLFHRFYRILSLIYILFILK